MDSTAGKLLVATPTLLDPNFARTVVLMIEHTADGALGVVVNRPTETPATRVLPDCEDTFTEPATIFVGGPVQATETLIGLARVAPGSSPDGWHTVVGPVGLVDLSNVVDVLGALSAFRVFAGYAGWGGGQLDDEIGRGDWFVVGADAGDAFSDSPESLWRAVLRRQGGDLAVAANFPPELSAN